MYPIPGTPTILYFDSRRDRLSSLACLHVFQRALIEDINPQIDSGHGEDPIPNEHYSRSVRLVSASGQLVNHTNDIQINFDITSYPKYGRCLKWSILKDVVTGLQDFFSEEEGEYYEVWFHVLSPVEVPGHGTQELRVAFGWLDRTNTITDPSTASFSLAPRALSSGAPSGSTEIGGILGTS